MVNNTEKLETNLSARLDRFDYADNREISATDQLYKGKIRYRATSLFGISAEAGYVRDSQPGRDIETSGIILSAVPRNRYNASLSADYQLSEKTAAGVSYAFGRDDYESARYTGYTSHDVNAGLVYDMGRYFQRVKGRVNLGYSNYVFPDSRIDAVMSTAGFSLALSEKGSLLIDGGVRHTWSEFSVAEPEYMYINIGGGIYIPIFIGYVKSPQKNDGWGWVGNMSLLYEGERGNGSLTYNRDITPASGLNGAVERNALMLSARYRMTYEFSILFQAAITRISLTPGNSPHRSLTSEPYASVRVFVTNSQKTSISSHFMIIRQLTILNQTRRLTEISCLCVCTCSTPFLSKQ